MSGEPELDLMRKNLRNKHNIELGRLELEKRRVEAEERRIASDDAMRWELVEWRRIKESDKQAAPCATQKTQSNKGLKFSGP